MRKKNKDDDLLRSEDDLSPWEKARLSHAEKESLQKVTRKKHYKISSPQLAEFHLPKFGALKERRLKEGSKRLLILFLSLTLLALLYILPIFRVEKVTVKGNTMQSDAMVIKEAQLIPKMSLFEVLFREGKIASNLKQAFPTIETANLTIGLGQVQVVLKEKKTVGYMVKASKLYPIVEKGIVASKALPDQPASLPMYYGFKKEIALQKVVLEVQKFKPNILNLVSEVHASPTKSDPDRLKLYMSDGNQVVATRKTMAQKMKYYAKIASQMDQAGVINFQVGAYSYSYH
ncbi:cell division protein FtsQ/DivIB [Ligilactobacillus equi]|nr:cell division protein FtsQ/DivIB [Ligilactobacillus equi]KRL85273.1 cell division protein [Ligilactobacillus equi DSM 15833 = JCM 10991]MCQ2556387.1 cell division protein FtsQ/DivIB [Ligilactobacillus sp.]